MRNRKLDGPEVLPGLICIVVGVFSSAVGLGLIPGKIKEQSNKVKNYHSLRSFGRANARPF